MSAVEADFQSCLRRGADLFNRREFFEAHEVWEDAWRVRSGDPARFLQGLIQVAAGFVKLQRRQPRGARALLERAHEKLRPFAPCAHGLDIERLLDSVAAWERVAEAMIRGEDPAIDASAFPSLQLRAPDP
ncbi:MAG: DUF309 domain-containing protein [Acidobacteriota bacterium]